MSWTLLQNSLLVAGLCAVLATFWGLAVGIFAATLAPRWRSTLSVLAVVAFVLPPFLTANTWMQYFGLAGTLRPYVPFNIYSLPATVLLIALQLWPVAFFFTLQGLLRIDRTYLELDALLGGQTLVSHVIWPSVRAGLWQAGIISFVLALNNFSIPALLQTKVYAAEVWLSFNTQFNYWEAWKLAWPLVLGPLGLLALFRRKKLNFVFRGIRFPASLLSDRIGSVRHGAALITGLLLAASVLFPLVQLLFTGRTWAELLPAIAASRGATLNSLLFSAGPAAMVLFLGWLMRKASFPFFLWIFFLTPGVLLGISLIWSLNRPLFAGFYSSVGIVVLAYALRFLAVGWSGARIVSAGFDQLPGDVIRAFGGTGWQEFRLAAWPQSRHLILGVFLLIYLLCLWEVETLILIVPPGRETLALRIFNMLHYGHAAQVNALCVWLLALAIAPVVLFAGAARIFRRLPLLLALAWVGCSPSGGNQLKSQIFSSVEVIGTRGTGAGQLNKPRSLAVDLEDNLYVVDMSGRVQKFSPDGRFLLSWQMPETDKGKPKGMLRDGDGNIVVIEPHYARVNHFDASGHLVSQWYGDGTPAGKLIFPRSGVVNSAGEIFLSEFGAVERVVHFSAFGKKFLGSFGSPGVDPGQFNRAEGLGIGPEGELFVADSCNHRVQVFTQEGRLSTVFGGAGSGVGEMSYPYDVRVDATGLRFVCEYGNSRVQIFDQQNRPVEIVGGPGAEPGAMDNPWAIALDSRGNLYVADGGNHRVQKFIRREPLAPKRVALGAQTSGAGMNR